MKVNIISEVMIKMIGPGEVSLKNVELYHGILKRVEKFASGAEMIFQAWLDPGTHDAIRIGDTGENVAFTSKVIPKLVLLTSKVDTDCVKTEYSAWLKKMGDSHIPNDQEVQDLVKEFSTFSKKLRAIVDKDMGIICISC